MHSNVKIVVEAAFERDRAWTPTFTVSRNLRPSEFSNEKVKELQDEALNRFTALYDKTPMLKTVTITDKD